MPDLTKDPLYLATLHRYLEMHARELRQYQERLASAAQRRTANALARMNGDWNEDTLREAFNGWEQEATRIALNYIHETLKHAGRHEAEKRLAELERLGLTPPPNLQNAHEELQQTGALTRLKRHAQHLEARTRGGEA